MPSRSGAGFDKNPSNINRKGRPKKTDSFTYFLWSVMSESEVTYRDKKITGKEAVARKALELALKGDMTAIKYIADRLDGAPYQPFEHSGPDGGPIDNLIQIEFVNPPGEK